MPNYLPYLLLTIINLPVMLRVVWKTRSYGTFVAFLSFVGMIYIFEYVILVLLNSYEYTPHILPHRFQDNIIGAVVSDFITLPTIALVIAVFRLRVSWIVCFALLFAGIEWLFVYLNIYRLHWWRIYYTIPSITFFFWLCRSWFNWLRDGKSDILYATLLLYAFSLIATMMFFYSTFGIRLFQIGVFQDPYHDDVFLASLFAAFKALLMTTVVYFTQKIYIWLSTLFVVLVAVDLLAIRFHLLKVMISLGLYITLYLVCCTVIIGLIYLAHRSLQKFPTNAASTNRR